MKALVTGGGGFLGGAIVRQLIKRGDEVKSFSRKEYPELTKLGVKHVQGDLSIKEHVSNAAKGCSIIFHVAAKPGYWGPYKEYYDANVKGTENILRACRQQNIRRLVYTSSPSVIFQGGNMEGVDESAPYPEHFMTAYPETKSIAEKMVLEANNNDLATLSLRPHLIWGPGDNHLLPRIISKARSGRLMIIGKGNNLIDTVYVDNAARAHLQAGDKLEPGSPVAGKAYFITNGEPKAIKEIFNLIMDSVGLPPVRKRVPPFLAFFGAFILESLYKILGIKSEPLVTRFLVHELSEAHWFDISAARRDFGYDPERIPFSEGIKILKDYYIKTGEYGKKK